MAQLANLALPDDAAAELERLRTVVALVQAALPDLSVTLDPVENRGFEYHTGVSFSLFARGIRGELGRGGRYLAQAGEKPEPATGFTLYMDTVIHAVPAPAAKPRLFLPIGTARQTASDFQAQGYATVFGLEPIADVPRGGDPLGLQACPARRHRHRSDIVPPLRSRRRLRTIYPDTTEHTWPTLP